MYFLHGNNRVTEQEHPWAETLIPIDQIDTKLLVRTRHNFGHWKWHNPFVLYIDNQHQSFYSSKERKLVVAKHVIKDPTLLLSI